MIDNEKKQILWKKVKISKAQKKHVARKQNKNLSYSRVSQEDEWNHHRGNILKTWSKKVKNMILN